MKKKRIFAFLLIFIMLTGLCGCSASAKGMNLANQKKIAELNQKAEPFRAEHTAHNIGKTVTVTEYNRPLSYALQYPKTGYAETDLRIESIVAEIRNAFEQEYTPAEAEQEKTKKAALPQATLYLAYESYLTDETNLSLLFFETHETEEGVSPHTRIQAFHFDLKTDAEVTAEELIWEHFKKNASVFTQKYFTETEPYSQRIFGEYATRLAPENGYFDRFAFTEEGVLFHFDRYSLFPGSMGIVSLTIPYADLRVKPVPEADKNTLPPAAVSVRKMVALT